MTQKHKTGNRWGLRCPECGRDDEIEITAIFRLHLGRESENPGFIEIEACSWDLREPGRCHACGFEACVVSFVPSDRSRP